MSSRAALWYQAIRQRGDDDQVVAWQMVGDYKVRHTYLHSETDGVGAYHRFLSQTGAVNLKIHGLGASHRVSRWKRLYQTFRALKRTQSPNVTWPLNSQAVQSSHFHQILFSESEVSQLKEYCRSQEISLRAYLLFYLHSYFISWVRAKDHQGSWLIPVSLRRENQMANYENRASYFLLPLENSQSAKDVDRALRKNLKMGSYWGTFYLLNLLTYLGYGVVKYLSDRNAQRGSFMGTFSDIGEWTFEHSDPQMQKQMWASAPIASLQYPIGITKLIINNKMSLGIKVHGKILCPAPEEIDRQLISLKEKIMRSPSPPS